MNVIWLIWNYLPDFSNDNNYLSPSTSQEISMTLSHHHPFKEGGRSKCKLAIRRCFGGEPMKMYAYMLFFIVFIASLHFDRFVDCNYVPPRFTDLQLFSRGGKLAIVNKDLRCRMVTWIYLDFIIYFELFLQVNKDLRCRMVTWVYLDFTHLLWAVSASE